SRVRVHLICGNRVNIYSSIQWLASNFYCHNQSQGADMKLIGLLVFVSMFYSTHALAQQSIEVDEGSQLRTSGESQSLENGNRALFEALAEGRRQGAIARSAESGRNP